MSPNDADDSEDYECPECGRADFANGKGMRIHHKKVHGESIAQQVTITCANCGTEKERPKALAAQSERHFCSPQCQHTWQESAFAGEGNPAWKGGYVEVECHWCDSGTKEIPPAWVNESGRHFCSEACELEWATDYFTGDKNPNWVEYVDVACEVCGSVKSIPPAWAKKSTRYFCSPSCKGAWLSEYLSGDGSPRWKGGHGWYYGPNWRRQRSRARERDGYECQACGLTDNEHEERYGQELHVHHISRKEAFRGEDGGLDFEAANALENLVTLCYSCHARWEGIPLRPQPTD